MLFLTRRTPLAVSRTPSISPQPSRAPRRGASPRAQNNCSAHLALFMRYVTPMRRAPSCTTAVLVALLGTLTSLASGCTLYWGGETADDYYYPPDAGPQYYPDAYPYPYPDAGGSISFARCEDGTIRHISMSSLPPGDMPGHGAGTVAGTCANARRSAVA